MLQHKINIIIRGTIITIEQNEGNLFRLNDDLRSNHCNRKCDS